MVQVTDQIAALGKSQLEAALKLAEHSVNTAEKFADLQLKWNKAAYEDAVQALRQYATTRDVGEIAGLVSGSAQPAWDKAGAYARSVYEVVSAAQAELATLVEQQVAELNRNVVVAVDAAVKSAPAGSETALTAFKSAIHSANSMYEAVAKATKQVTSATEANLASFGAPVATAAKKKAA